MKRLSLVLLFSFLTLIFLFSQEKEIFSEYSYKRYTTQDGIPQMLIESLFQDSKGYIWIGTLSGFSRFDGFTFSSYLKGDAENIVRFVEQPSDSIFNFYAIHYRRKHQLIELNDSISTSQLDTNGEIYNYYNSSLLPDGYGIFENSDEKGRVIRDIIQRDTVSATPLLDKMDESRKMYWDTKNGRLFIPTFEGLYALNQRDSTDLELIDKSNVHTVFVVNDIVYALATDGIYRYFAGALHLLIRHNFDPVGSGINVCTSRSGNLIIGDTHSIYSFDGKEVELLMDGINLVRQLMVDFEGNIWVATYQGLYNLFRLNFKNTFLEDNNDIIRSVGFVGDNLWLGTLNGKLYSSSENGFVRRAYP